MRGFHPTSSPWSNILPGISSVRLTVISRKQKWRQIRTINMNMFDRFDFPALRPPKCLINLFFLPPTASSARIIIQTLNEKKNVVMKKIRRQTLSEWRRDFVGSGEGLTQRKKSSLGILATEGNQKRSRIGDWSGEWRWSTSEYELRVLAGNTVLLFSAIICWDQESARKNVWTI